MTDQIAIASAQATITPRAFAHRIAAVGSLIDEEHLERAFAHIATDQPNVAEDSAIADVAKALHIAMHTVLWGADTADEGAMLDEMLMEEISVDLLARTVTLALAATPDRELLDIGPRDVALMIEEDSWSALATALRMAWIFATITGA